MEVKQPDAAIVPSSSIVVALVVVVELAVVVVVVVVVVVAVVVVVVVAVVVVVVVRGIGWIQGSYTHLPTQSMKQANNPSAHPTTHPPCRGIHSVASGSAVLTQPSANSAPAFLAPSPL